MPEEIVSRLRRWKILRRSSVKSSSCRRKRGLRNWAGASRKRSSSRRIQILELLAACKGNLVRVHDELVRRDADVSYPALTAFCRRHGIGQEPKVAFGHYHFQPGAHRRPCSAARLSRGAGSARTRPFSTYTPGRWPVGKGLNGPQPG